VVRFPNKIPIITPISKAKPPDTKTKAHKSELRQIIELEAGPGQHQRSSSNRTSRTGKQAGAELLNLDLIKKNSSSNKQHQAANIQQQAATGCPEETKPIRTPNPQTERAGKAN
jgi:predicted P-loop ATPase